MNHRQLVVRGVALVLAVVVEGLREVLHLSDFGQTQAEVVVFGSLEAGVDATDLVVDRTPHQPKVEGHEVEQQLVFGVGNLAALAQSMILSLGVDDVVIGVDHPNIGMGIKNGGGLLQGGGGKQVVAINAVCSRAVGASRSSLSTQPR